MATTDDLLKQKLLDYLGVLETATKQGSDFVLDQAPAVAREIVAYNLVSYGLQALVCLILAIGMWLVLVRCAVRVRSQWEESDSDIRVGYGFALLVGVALNGLVLFSLVMTLNNLLKCYFAPRYFVLEKILQMTAGH